MPFKQKTFDTKEDLGELVGKVSADLMILGAVTSALAATLIDILW